VYDNLIPCAAAMSVFGITSQLKTAPRPTGLLLCKSTCACVPLAALSGLCVLSSHRISLLPQSTALCPCLMGSGGSEAMLGSAHENPSVLATHIHPSVACIKYLDPPQNLQSACAARIVTRNPALHTHQFELGHTDVLTSITPLPVHLDKHAHSPDMLTG
jgi:hypothetical protein